MDIFLFFITLWIIASLALFLLYAGHEITAVWREPVLRRPVLIIESDDWGAGPAGQADALKEIASRLSVVQDCDGHPPVMTLGIILASADGKRIKATGNYHRRTLSRSEYKGLLDAITSGVDSGVFTVQLHGLEHYWPPALMAASYQDEAVSTWLDRTPEASTEDLPSPLQSRWVDASVLPAQDLSAVEISKAVKEEVDTFRSIFGHLPRVVVPPTFIWNETVEQAWAEAGVEVIVTPGRRYETRDATGHLAGAGTSIYNGEAGRGGIVYLVRNDYFEPALGHTAKQAIAALETKTRLGRPTLLETHRFNFLGSDERQTNTLAELKKLLQRALDMHPDLAFLSTEKLARALVTRDRDWVEQRLARRIHVWLARLGELSRLRKLAWLTGWIGPAWLVWKLTG